MRLEGILCFSLFRLSFSLYSGFLGIELKRNLIFSIFFMCIYSIVIALFKDVPDVMGDAQEGIQTLTVRFGVKLAFIPFKN
jgi:homogentisate phytyltransferase/homogentisate geranylgeranyltransferase